MQGANQNSKTSNVKTTIKLGDAYDNLTFNAAVMKGGFIFISGLAADGEGGIALADNIVDQTEIIYQKMEKVLEGSWGKL